jgi:hypothetical protein
MRDRTEFYNKVMYVNNSDKMGLMGRM